MYRQLCIVSGLLALAGHPARAAGPDGGAMTSSAGRQIGAVLRAKEALTPAQRKLSSDLLLATPSPQADALRSATAAGRVQAGREVLVDIAAEVSADLERAIREKGGSIVQSTPEYGAIRALVPTSELEKIAEFPQVRSVRSADAAQTRRVNVGAGVRAHGVEDARARFGVDGTGVRVGILSDSVEALAQLQASGDLPPGVAVLPGQAGQGASEGTAMLEIVHDLAPGAQLLFATAFSGQAGFAANIRALRQAGADVIVDDVGYFREPVFQDGIVAQAVEDIVADGGQYYSSAGNSGNANDRTSGVWEGDFRAATPPLPLVGIGDAHDFGGVVGDVITADSPSVFTLQWSDPFGASGNDYDLFLLDPGLTRILASSVNVQDGDDDPFEQISSGNVNDADNVLVVVRSAGASTRYLHLNANRGRLAVATAGQTAGHSAAEGAFSVAAVDVASAGGALFVGGSSNPVERFSSDGPRRVFYRRDGQPLGGGGADGTPAVAGVVREKPDLAAADGVATATPGFDPFFGTSAAAPHAAAIGALLLALEPSLTPAMVRSIYAGTALDIEAPGRDRDSGVGLIMADRALAEAGRLREGGVSLTASPAVSPTTPDGRDMATSAAGAPDGSAPGPQAVPRGPAPDAATR